MNYQVPHFLETEQRIWGPFTFASFVIMIGIAGFLWVLYYLIGFGWWITITIIVGSVTLGLMFGSYNGRALYFVFFDVLKHLIQPRRYTWQGVEQKEGISEFILTKESLRSLPSIGEAKKEERPIGERIEEIGKALDER